ncbi:MAG: phosphoribosylformylglycinamidine synthase I [Gemmataceae bacterium]|nr:phosphoribosylformylglycinamidine synthase I [Gemmataceae bacterium]
MASPRVLILRAPGSNCDKETEFAFQKAGVSTQSIHIIELRKNPMALRDFQILVIPGGFTYGDDVAAGKILANQLASFLGQELRSFRDREKLILGICNGFQVLLKAGLILQPDEEGPLATLAHNTSGRFEARWVNLSVTPGKCPFLKNMDRLLVPVAHGEGRFVTRTPWIQDGLEKSGQVVLRFINEKGELDGFPCNPNGSQGNVAGLCDPSGRVLGLMPHPERHLLPTQHPRWTREGLKPHGEGFALFQNAVEYFK